MEVPGRWFKAYVQMMSRLEGQEALATISQIAAGNGLMDQQNQKQYLDQLRRAANTGQRVEAATVAALALIGVQVETVEASEQTQRIARLQAKGGVLLGEDDPGVDDDGAGGIDLAAQLLG